MYHFYFLRSVRYVPKNYWTKENISVKYAVKSRFLSKNPHVILVENQ